MVQIFFFLTFKRLIFLFLIRIRIDQILWIWIHIRLMRIHITGLIMQLSTTRVHVLLEKLCICPGGQCCVRVHGCIDPPHTRQFTNQGPYTLWLTRLRIQFQGGGVTECQRRLVHYLKYKYDSFDGKVSEYFGESTIRSFR